MGAPHPIEVEAISKRFGRLSAVSEVSFEVAEGEILGFLGPNGAGKTTTMRMLMGFLRPTSGTSRILGAPLATHPYTKRSVGYLPGDFRMDAAMSGWDLFRWFGRIRGHVPEKRIRELLERLGLDANRPAGSLSKGNRQKVGIVQALMNDPRVLILDEPTGGLDPLVQREFVAIIREAVAGGVAVLFSSHVLPEVERLAARVAIIRSGKIVMQGSVDELLDHAKHRLELRYANPIGKDAFRGVDGVTAYEVDGKTVTLTVDGPAGPALRAAAALDGLLRVSPASDELEDLFVELYGRSDGHD